MHIAEGNAFPRMRNGMPWYSAAEVCQSETLQRKPAARVSAITLAHLNRAENCMAVKPRCVPLPWKLGKVYSLTSSLGYATLYVVKITALSKLSHEPLDLETARMEETEMMSYPDMICVAKMPDTVNQGISQVQMQHSTESILSGTST